ncbi:hypothetical protein N0V90_006146 [Kalmusia sp. IMI 367209]|nr:hypothetical protein N0V90_006146 [Kalmusia sp. IMI 367209]
MEEPASDKHSEKDVYDNAKASKFQFKSKSDRHSKRRPRNGHDHDDYDEKKHNSKRHRSEDDSDSRRPHRRSKRRHRHGQHDHTFTRNGEYGDPDRRYRESLYDNLSDNHADPDALFRESIFDAMADDEGADYWEGVYGQPIHIYPNTRSGPDGKLERMTDEEYADFVRTKMWEKSHQHILEERAARERARQKRKEQNRELENEAAKEEAEREKIRRQMEESLHRSAERKKAKEAEASWAKYLAKWEHLKNKQEPGLAPREIIPWPVASGRASQVEAKAIEQFLTSSNGWREDALALLKLERVRWHPDKMQQRFGQHIDSETMKIVTATFQVVDRLWNERNRHRK